MSQSKIKSLKAEEVPTDLGARIGDAGLHFSIYAPEAKSAWLALFENANSSIPATEIALTRTSDCAQGVWRAYIADASEGTYYAWRFEGTDLDSTQYILDPYARAVAYEADAAFAKGIVVANTHPQWNRPGATHGARVIYEMHVSGFTKSDTPRLSSGGRYVDVIEKIPYLKDLGVTAVELLPVHACGELVLDRTHPELGEPLTNYWGYNPLTFMAPDPRYANNDGRAAVEEFRTMVHALHAADIEVIVDVVYNHTAEMGVDGPTQSLRGLDEDTYYILDKAGAYLDFTGCGNSVRAANPITANLIVDSLRHWHTELGVDGFRFDLASVLNRDNVGHLDACAPIVERIANDSELASAHLIAEAWDTGGAYQVGNFGTSRWQTWNDRFRDDVRRYWRGDHGLKGEFAMRLTGSPDIYGEHDRRPLNSINFVSSHDGFTLRDVVSYNEKHNEANGENNRDGHNHDHSWNCGTEGDTDHAEINDLRGRMQRSMLASLFLSLGVPMLAAGDECGRTQRGNNNAYCQDNDISWFDWTLPERNHDMLQMVQRLIAFRKANPVFGRDTFFSGDPAEKGLPPDIASFDFAGKPLQWESMDDAMACRIDGATNGGTSLYLMFNPTLLAREFYLPEGAWKLTVDTTLAPYFMDQPIALEETEPYILGRKGLALATSS